MCGIAGVHAPDRGASVDKAALERMLARIRHRGPDRQVVETPAPGVGLAHARLKIIDLSSAADQPMWSSDRRYAVVYNGEIFNFKERRSELEGLGHSFRTCSDTEVLLEGFSRWGIKVLERLNGQFAFALWDSRDQRLWLVRDRLGEKPLYWRHDGAKNEFAFASELKALLEWPGVRREIDHDALRLYLALGYVPAPHCMLKGVRKLPAGHWLRHDASGVEVRRWWRLPELGSWKGSEEEARSRVRAAVEAAVERRLVSDVPLGAYLSGGVDSTIVVGVMSKLLKEPARTFSAAYDAGASSAKYNVDADAAEGVARRLGCRHTRLTIRLEDRLEAALKDTVWHMDEPIANPTALSTYLLARKVKEQGVTVVLSGDGSDEAFAGYERYRSDRAVTWARRVPGPARGLLLAVAKRAASGSRLHKVLAKAQLEPRSAERYLTWCERFPAEEARALLLWARNGDEGRGIEELLPSASGGGDQDWLSAADLSLWIPEESNMRVDKTSMAHALEVRPPFLDHEVIETAMALPFALKAGKRLLKEAFSDLLPPEVASRQKWGWLSPAYHWLSGPLWPVAKDALTRLPDTRLFTPEVRGLIDAFPSPDFPRVWALMVFGLWHRMYIEGRRD